MKHIKKTCIVGDSHTRRIKKNLFNDSITEGKAHLNSFSGATINRLDYFITPILEEDRPDILIIHVASNDITHNTMNNINAKGIPKRIIDIRKKSLLHGVKEVIILYQYLSKDKSNSLGSSDKSMISYTMNAEVTVFISLVTTTSPMNVNVDRWITLK